MNIAQRKGPPVHARRVFLVWISQVGVAHSFFWAGARSSAELCPNAPAAVSESPRGTVGWADGLGIEPIARRVLVTKAQLGLTLQANPQTKQRHDTHQGLTLRARLSNDINE
jgi:hypothetical protein